YGRRRIFVFGLAIFTLSSLACGLAPSAGYLIGARAVQGVGAALMNPATLSIIVATFPPKQRGQAIGSWAGVSALALAIGPLGGGLIVDNLNWNWIFFVNVPVGILGIVVSQFAIRESRDTSAEQSIDLPGLLTSIGFLFSLSYALVEGNGHGWTSPEILGLFAAAAILLVAFIVVEKRQRLPMLDLSLFKIGAFTGSNVVAMLGSLSMSDLGSLDLDRLSFLAQLRPRRGERPRLALARDPRSLRGGGHPARRLHRGREAAAAAHARPLALQDRSVHRLERRGDARLALDVRRLLLRLALHPEHPRLLGDAGGRRVPADGHADHPHRAALRQAVRPDRFALADG